jgi:hypothetical protein
MKVQVLPLMSKRPARTASLPIVTGVGSIAILLLIEGKDDNGWLKRNESEKRAVLESAKRFLEDQ